MNYTDEDFQKEIKKVIDELYQKGKEYGILKEKTEEEMQKEKEDAQRVERATKRYMEIFEEIPELNEYMSYLADNGIAIIVNPTAQAHGYTENTITLATSTEYPDQLEMEEVESITNVISSHISADKFYSRMIESYNNSPSKDSNYLNWLLRYVIVKHLSKPHYGYIEEKVVVELMMAMMLHTMNAFGKEQVPETQVHADEVFSPNTSEGNCEFCTIIKDGMLADADFCLRMQDDSMINIGIKPGDLVFFKEHMDIKDGDVVAVLIDGKYHLKTIYFKDDVMVLSTENYLYESMFYNKDADIKICGKLVMLQHKFENVKSEVG